jgi:Uma2 family endonuclease
MSFQLTIQDIPHYSYKDYEMWEGDWELIRGIPYAMVPAPDWMHQEFGGSFVQHVRNAFDKNKNNCSCKVLYECDWLVSDDTVIRPDVMVVCDPIEGKYPVKPPVLILEILSPSSILKDRNTKFKLYQSYGVKYYLIANVDRKEIEYFVLIDNQYKQAQHLVEYSFTPACTVTVNLSGIFQ